MPAHRLPAAKAKASGAALKNPGRHSGRGGAEGKPLGGAFKQAATLYDRLKVEVLISSENADDFEKNLLTMRAEERLALAVKRPPALIKGTF